MRCVAVRSSRANLVGLAALVALALALRLRGLDFFLPLLPDPDANIVRQVELMEQQSPRPEQHTGYVSYPHLIARAVTLFSSAQSWDNPPPALSIEQHLARAGAPFRRVRQVVAIMSLLAVPATWLLARNYLSPAWSLLAASAMVTSLLTVCFAQQARPHAASMAFPALAVLSCIALRRRGTVVAYLLAGCACGLALGALQSGVAVLIPLAVAHTLSSGTAGWRHLRLLLSLAMVALCLYAFYPFLFTSGADNTLGPVGLADSTLTQGGHKLFLHLFNGRGLPTVVWWLWSYEPALVIGSALGTAAWLARLATGHSSGARAGASDHLVVLSYAVPYFAVLLLYGRTFERFLLPLLPFLACLSAYGLHAVWHTLAGQPRLGRLAPWPAALLIALWVGFPALAAERLTHARAAPSTVELAGDWLRQHTTPGVDRIVLGFALQVPLYGDPAEISKIRKLGMRNLPWVWYQKQVFHRAPPDPRYLLIPLPFSRKSAAQIARFPGEFLAAQNALCFVTQVYASRVPVFEALRDTLQRTSILVARFSPDDDAENLLPIGYQGDLVPGREHMSTRVLRAHRAGPVIEIFCTKSLASRGST